jgi:hypothetical protein
MWARRPHPRIIERPGGVARRSCRKPRRALFLAPVVAAALLGAGCTGGSTGRADAHGTPSAVRLGLVIPATYQQACAYADGTCMPGDTGPIPTALKRPLHWPHIGPSGRCPASRGHRTTTPFVTGVLLGRGLVEPLITNPVTQGGTATLGTTEYPHWRALKVIWMSPPSYQGPFVVRGTRLDRRGILGFGGSPQPGPLVAPPGPTINSYSGYRTWPDAAWVRHPGCYAWQVDGLAFSETIVVRLVLPGPRPE